MSPSSLSDVPNTQSVAKTLSPEESELKRKQTSEFPKFHFLHAAYVTRDVERGKRKLSQMYGAQTFRTFDSQIESHGGVARIKVAVTKINGFIAEVIEPCGGNDAVYRDALPSDPDEIVFHHFASRVFTAEDWDKVKAIIQSKRLETPVLGNYKGVLDYLYVDLRKETGHMMEYIFSTDDIFREFMPEIMEPA